MEIQDLSEVEILGRHYLPDTFRRVVAEGYEAYCQHGPYRNCPYGSDQRNGAWSFGARQAQAGYSRDQAWENFKRQENL